MKKHLTWLILLSFAVLNNLCTTKQSVPFTASELVEKSIKFHDPEGKWNNFSGKVALTNIDPSGNSFGTEIIEIGVAEDFYNWTRLAGGMKISRGIKDGKIFYSVNGNSNPSPQQIKDFGLVESEILMMKEWHYFHFGKLAHFKSGGSVLQEKVTRNNLKGNECFLITYTGDSSKVTLPWWAGEIGFYIDSKTFAIAGMNWSSLNSYETMEGYLDINGIKLPRVRNFYTKEDDLLQYVDVFTLADDNFRLPESYRTRSLVTGSNIGLVSTHLLNLKNEEALKRLQEPLKEINEVLAEMGYPECGYVVYKVTPDYKSVYTHIMEGRWTSEEVYELTHNHPKYKEVFEKYSGLIENALTGRAYLRASKMMPEL